MDRLPPYAEESEKAVIGCCFIEPKTCLPEAQQTLTAAHFYSAQCQLAWELMNGMQLDQINSITVRQRLIDSRQIAEDSVDGFLFECEDLVTSTANMGVWIGEIVEKFTLRQILKTCATLSGLASAPRADAERLLDTAEREMLAIRPSQRVCGDIKTLVNEAVGRIEDKFNNRGSIIGLSTGLVDLDRMSDGLHGGEMVVIAGLPSTGKTALAVNIAIHSGLAGIPIAIFSAEMRPVELVIRALCSNARANYHFLEERAVAAMISVAGALACAPIYIEGAHGQSAGQVCASARRLHQKHGIKIMVVDYIQLLSGPGDNREQEVASISGALKAISLELNIAVIALSQLNEKGQMRESRAISQDADSIWKLENDGEWQPQIQPVFLKIEKCRHGETGIVNLTFLKQFTLFQNSQKVSKEDIQPPYKD